MTKIVHISDVHFRPIQRHEEYKQSFIKLFEELREIKPDFIINTGDFYHLKTAQITPEVINIMSWAFKGLSNIAKTYSILGNHDVNLTNPDRGNILRTIHDLLDDDNLVLLEKSETITLNSRMKLHAYSPTDKTNWGSLKPDSSFINIALFHGSVTGSETDNGWKLQGCEENLSFFKEQDFVFLGDIHKHQYLAHRADKNNVQKPWIAYPGSLIQQNFGENIEKGYLVWDIKDVDDWDVSWKQLFNFAPFVTIPWSGSVKDTVQWVRDSHNEFAFMPGTRYRIVTNTPIPQVQKNLLIKTLKDFGAKETVFKLESDIKLEDIKVNGMQISKNGLSNDPEAIMNLYKEYINNNKESYNFNDKEFDEVYDILNSYLSKLNTKEKNSIQSRNAYWAVKTFKFDNLFGYGEGNVINFENLNGIVGIFGNNKIGKSSIIGGLIYTLFNTTDRGSLKNSDIINRNKNECFGSVRLTVNDVDYVIERRTIRSKKNFDSSNTIVNFFKIKNENGLEVKVSQNADSGPDTDAAIRNLIGTADDFMLTTLASQGNLNRFIENKVTKRKEILNRFLELDIFEQLFDFAKLDYSTSDNQNKNYSLKNIGKTIESLEQEITNGELELKTIQDEIDLLNKKRDELNVWIKSHENLAVASTELENFDKLTKELKNLEKLLDSANEQLVVNKTKLSNLENKKLSTIEKLNNIDISKLKNDKNTMSEIEKTISEIKQNLNIQNEKYEFGKKAVYKLTVVPCGDEYPECHFIKDGHEAKKTISEQEQLVKDLANKLEESKKIFDNYAFMNLADSIKEYEILSFDKTMLESNIEHCNDIVKNDLEKINSLTCNINNVKQKLSNSEKSLQKLDSTEFKKNNQEIQQVQNKLADLSKAKNDKLIKLGGTKQSLEIAKQEQEENKNLIHKLKIYESIQAAFSKTGIPAMILKTQLPSVNRELSRLLDTSMDLSVSLETDTTSNSLDILVSDIKSKRIVEMCSGMEKTVCSLSLRVALTNLSTLPKTDMLILDEPFGALDEESLQKGIEFLSLLRGWFKCILVISHETAIKEIADRVLEVQSVQNTESKIEVK